MREVEHHDVQFRAERRLEVVLPVETLLRELLLRRVDGLLLVRELARERVQRLPLRGARVGVDRDEERRGRRHDVGRARAGIRRPSAAGEHEGEPGEKEPELPHYLVVTRASNLLSDPGPVAPKATSVSSRSSWGSCFAVTPKSDEKAWTSGVSLWTSA